MSIYSAIREDVRGCHAVAVRPVCYPRSWLCILAVSAATASASVAAEVVFVKADAQGTNDGSSWENAYLDLQDGLDHAEASGGAVNEIWTAAGTYRPSKRTDPDDPRSATFQLLNGLGIYGGFAGWENDRDQRDGSAGSTVLSGDLADDDDRDFAN